MSHFSWVQLLGGLVHVFESLGLSHADAVIALTTWLICFGLLGLALLARRGLNRAIALGGTLQYVPVHRPTITNFFEIYTQAIFNLAESILGKKDARTYYWLIGGLFIYILVGNLLSVVPGTLPPTDNISNNFAMALTVFLVFNAAGLVVNGFGYVRHLMGPVLLLSWLMFPIELIGLLVRPVSLSVRLAGNIFGDHTVFGIMSQLSPAWLPIPAIFLALGIFVSFLQAFVFTLLSTIYIGLSVAHEEH